MGNKTKNAIKAGGRRKNKSTTQRGTEFNPEDPSKSGRMAFIKGKWVEYSECSEESEYKGYKMKYIGSTTIYRINGKNYRLKKRHYFFSEKDFINHEHTKAHCRKSGTKRNGRKGNKRLG